LRHTSERKIRANRANAQASTGPKTTRGRIRSARNALRHALSLPVHSDPALSEEAATVAREIAGLDANAEMQELARRVAEAQIDLRRVRIARHDLLSRALGDPDYDSPAATRKKSKLAVQLAYLKDRLALVPHLKMTSLGTQMKLTPTAFQEMLAPLVTDMSRFVQSQPEGPHKFATILSDMAERLAVMDRYERRALSRRKFAIRAFDLAKCRQSLGL
jgi:hypothetical protein